MEQEKINPETVQLIFEKVENISQLLKKQGENYPLSEYWLDIPQTCQLLRISKRTLQNYRDNGVLSFSKIGGKIYFKAADIEAHLHKHYQKAFK